MQRVDDAHRMGRAVEEVGVAERDVARSGSDLLADVVEHDVDRHDAEATPIDRHHRAVTAQVLAAATRLDEAADPLLAIRETKLGVAVERGQVGAVRAHELDGLGAHAVDRLGSQTVAQCLGERQQVGLALPAEQRDDSELTQQRLVERCVEAIGREVGVRQTLAQPRQQLDRDARGGVHAEEDRDQAGPVEALGFEFAA